MMIISIYLFQQMKYNRQDIPLIILNYIYEFANMEDQEQYILEDEALNVLSLFPKREISVLTPSLQTYSRLFESLTCTICRELFSNPVYLKCSHRFCKECIEKYIRSNSRKSCPNCRGGLTTKRDLRSDFNLESLITFTFGDAKKMSRQLEQIERVQLSQLEREKGLELRKVQSLTDLKQKTRVESTEEAVVSLTSLKRSKTADGEEVRPKKRGPAQKKTKTGGNIDKEMTPFRRIKQAAEILEIKRESVEAPVQKRKRNQMMIIEIESSEPVEVLEIAPEQFFHAPEEINVGDNKLNSLMFSISMIPEVSEIESARKIASMRQLEREENNPEQENAVNSKMEGQEQPSQMVEEPPAVAAQVFAARQLLKQQFGSNYLNKIIQITDYTIFMRLQIKKHPSQPFTPTSTFAQIKVAAVITAGSITSIISGDLNVNREAIRLYVCQDLLNNFIEVSTATRLQQINNRFWRTFGGFQILQFDQYPQILARDEDSSNSRFTSWQNRILYYAVDYSKIII